MKSILKAIGRALAAIPRFVWQRVQECGEWVSRLVAVPAVPMDGGGQNESVGHPQRDEHLDAVRQVAALLYGDRVPSPDLVGLLSHQEMMWLAACNQEMLRAIARAKDPELSAHIKGRKPIRGVLLNDVEVIKDYLRSGERKYAAPEPETALKFA